ncbi:HIT family protein [Candidimonas sp. SYP-B2681]|uniref:HIT family protein n=1 Tax=Candidimonas sp. SYP-B2681 TaxID=2497686 RepID=UPI000F85FD88|nr:HIT family protein [Candidimonas sp. SYP-B2681]RTZ45698.1 HIT family protein [Candidimonas sp. SYP-B2681]
MTLIAACPLCEHPGGAVLWHNAHLRVIDVNDSSHPGFTRVVWRDHVSEMTQLQARQRNELMEVVWQVEQVQRDILLPSKVNIAQLGNMVPHLHWHLIPRWSNDSHFPEPIWAAAPVRSADELHAWQARKAEIEFLLPRYRSELTAALAQLPISAPHAR